MIMATSTDTKTLNSFGISYNIPLHINNLD